MNVSGKSLLLSVTLAATAAISASGQSLFTYGSKSVSKDEFLKAFNKNNTGEAPTTKAYADYLELYSKFKIKVQAAYDMKLDTMPNQKAELDGFKTQITDNYMSDDESLKKLVDEALERRKKDLHLQHIFVAIPSKATAEDISKAQYKINQAYSELSKDAEFNKVAATYSEDPSVKTNNGDIGFITVFNLPYDLETLAYATAAGKYSQPFQSRSGFHIFKNLGERKAAGRMKASQILLSFGPDMTDNQKQLVQQKADSIYKALQSGSDFKALAASFSTDNLTYQNGGELVEFGVGQYDPAFENAAFALQNDNDISKPVRTEFGYHIIKRLSRVPLNVAASDAETLNDLKLQVSQSDRIAVAQKDFLQKIQKTTGFKKLVIDETKFKKYSADFLSGKEGNRPQGLTETMALFSFSKSTVKLKDWETYLRSVRAAGNQNSKPIEYWYDQFVNNSIQEYYRSHLEDYNKEFRGQLAEFRDGNLLFEVMQKKVWDVAAADSVNLKKYYKEHQNKYWWEASADALIFTVSDEQESAKIRASLDSNHKNWRKIVETYEGRVQADSARFELSQIPVVDRTNFTEKLITANVKNEADKSVTFAYIIKLHKDKEQRNFDDARGFVINDYQSFLEEKWIAELKKKYPIKINQAVLASLPK